MDSKTLEELVEEEVRGGKSRSKVLVELYREWVEGRLLLKDPRPPSSFLEFLLRADYSTWYWFTVAVVATTLMLVFYVERGPLIIARYVLGSLIVLFLPGFVTVEALYPEEDELEPLERLALSIGLSLAIVPLIGLLLNYTPWGIRLTPIAASLSTYIVGVGFIAEYRKYRLTMLKRG